MPIGDHSSRRYPSDVGCHQSPPGLTRPLAVSWPASAPASCRWRHAGPGMGRPTRTPAATVASAARVRSAVPVPRIGSSSIPALCLTPGTSGPTRRSRPRLWELARAVPAGAEDQAGSSWAAGPYLCAVISAFTRVLAADQRPQKVRPRTCGIPHPWDTGAMDVLPAWDLSLPTRDANCTHVTA